MTDFSPRVQRIVQAAAAGILAVVPIVAVASLAHPAPWSPIGQYERNRDTDSPGFPGAPDNNEQPAPAERHHDSGTVNA